MKNLKFSRYIILILTLLLILPFIISPIINNLWLNHLAKELKEYPLPEKTKFIKQESICGKLNGNGNGMNFFSCILIKSDLSLDQIREHFNDIEFKSINKPDKIQLEVIPANGYKLKTHYLEHRDIYFDILKDLNDYMGYYVVMIYDGGYWGGLDIRAN